MPVNDPPAALHPEKKSVAFSAVKGAATGAVITAATLGIMDATHNPSWQWREMVKNRTLKTPHFPAGTLSIYGLMTGAGALAGAAMNGWDAIKSNHEVEAASLERRNPPSILEREQQKRAANAAAKSL